MSEEAIPKIEGHAAFYAHLRSGHVDKAQAIGLENDRFIEKILFGRKYWEAPIITSRICGICPTIHNMTSVRAIEAACNLKPTEQTKKLRKLMLAGQMIQSHSLHLYLLVLPDFVGASSSFELQKSHPELFQNAIELKKYADQIIETIGGRAVHPISNVPGGFKSYPSIEQLKKLQASGQKILDISLATINLFEGFGYPDVKHDMIESALHKDHEFAFYDGEIWNSKGTIFTADEYTKYIHEEIKPYTRAKFGTLKGKVMLVGSLARIKLGLTSLRPIRDIIDTTKLLDNLDNPFYNSLAQAIENYYFAKLSIDLVDHFIEKGIKKEEVQIPTEYGIGTAACEAPRGTLFHHYELDKNGYIVKADIVTPTVQNLPAIEMDMKNLEPIIGHMNAEDRKVIIEKLIRAYDPCITCATH
ncbi:MAG: Ni/Fe hydrogenase subunit alpha [bacterium]